MRLVTGLCLLSLSLSYGLAGDLRGRGEAAGFGGGVWISEGIGTKGYFGGSVAGGVSSKGLVYGEFTYVPVGSSGLNFVDFSSGITGSASASAKLLDFQGGIKYNVITSDRVEPYLILGAGVGRVSASGRATVVQGNQSVTVAVDESESHFGIHLGGGVRLYAGPRWGIQPEIKYGHYFADGGGGNVVRFGAGVFFQWGK